MRSLSGWSYFVNQQIIFIFELFYGKTPEQIKDIILFCDYVDL